MKRCAVCDNVFEAGWSVYWCSRSCSNKQAKINKRAVYKRAHSAKGREHRRFIKQRKNRA